MSVRGQEGLAEGLPGDHERPCFGVDRGADSRRAGPSHLIACETILRRCHANWRWRQLARSRRELAQGHLSSPQNRTPGGIIPARRRCVRLESCCYLSAASEYIRSTLD